MLEINSIPMLVPVRQPIQRHSLYRRSQSIWGNRTSTLQEWIDDIAMAPVLHFDMSIPDVLANPGKYLPPTRDNKPDIEVDNMLVLSSRSAQLEFIKLAIHLIANNIEDSAGMAETIVGLMKDEHHLSFLKRLLDQKLFMVEAFSEKLIWPALHSGNLPLLKVLKAGIKIKRLFLESDVTLIFAIRSHQEDIVTYLLDHGVSATGPIPYNAHSQISPLDCAVEESNIRIIEDLLIPRPSSTFLCPKVNIETLRIAVLAGDHDIIEFLMGRNPQLLYEIRSVPWLLYEAAAMHKTEALLVQLQDWGVDITMTDERGHGSALAAACEHADMPVIQYLLDLEVDINGIAFGCGYERPWRDHYNCREYDFPGTICGQNALCIALEQGHKHLVSLLLHNGASPHQFRDIPPIQIAASSGDCDLIEMLIKAGADVNAVLGPLSSHLYLALAKGNQSAVIRLTEIGVPLPNGDPKVALEVNKWNPLRAAIDGGNRNLVDWVLKRIDINYWATQTCLVRCVGKFGWSFTETLFDGDILTKMAPIEPKILWHCVCLGDQEVVETLVSNIKASLGTLPRNYGAIGLVAATTFKRISMMKFFLDAGANPYDYSPLITSLGGLENSPSMDEDISAPEVGALPDDPDIFKLLIDVGVNPYVYLRLAMNLKGLEGSLSMSALKEGVLSYDPDTFKLLLDACRNILKDKERVVKNPGILDAYRMALESGKLAALEMILDAGLDVRNIDDTIGLGSTKDHRVTSVQQYMGACEHSCNPEIVDILLNHGADPGAQAGGSMDPPRSSPQVHTPLQSAARLNSTEIVRKLLQRRVNVNAEPNVERGATALQFASINSNFEILNILIKAGANINAPPATFDGRSAIEGASEWGRLNMVKYLLEAGANVQGRKNKNYRRSIYRAWKNGHMALARTIQDWKAAKFGHEDCEDIEAICESVTEDELDLGDSPDLDGLTRWRCCRKRGRWCLEHEP